MVLQYVLWLSRFWFLVDVGGQICFDIEFLDAYFEAHVLWLCESWFFEGIGGQLYAHDTQILMHSLKPTSFDFLDLFSFWRCRRPNLCWDWVFCSFFEVHGVTLDHEEACMSLLMRADSQAYLCGFIGLYIGMPSFLGQPTNTSRLAKNKF